MIQDIYPAHYDNQFRQRDAQPGDRLLIFRNDLALLQVVDNEITFPVLGEAGGLSPKDCRSLFCIDDTFYSMPIAKEVPEFDSFKYYQMREYRRFRPFDRLFPCAVGGSLTRWYRDNRFCGRCGALNADSETERALVCPRCGKTTYPKICPAVITAVRDGDKILLTKYAGRPSVGYALIAGFNEIGESIEETVHREVLEEVGVKVKNLHFYKSQPWVFTDTLLMGFFCDLDGSSNITLQEDELSVGEWKHRSELTPDFDHVSLTAEMIEQFRIGNA